MKALSLTPPWPGAILHLGKRIENRAKWKGCSYRGPILLHAAKGIGSRDDFNATVDGIFHGIFPATLAPEPSLATISSALGVYGTGGRWHPADSMLRGGICGRARIDGVIRNEADFAAYASNVSGGEGQRRWWFGGFALVLTDVEPLPLVPWPGSLGLFNVPDDYATRSQ